MKFISHTLMFHYLYVVILQQEFAYFLLVLLQIFSGHVVHYITFCCDMITLMNPGARVVAGTVHWVSTILTTVLVSRRRTSLDMVRHPVWM